MRVLVVGLNYAPEPTGIAPYTAGFARGLVDRGHAVRILTAMPHYPEWRIRDGYEGSTRRERIDRVSVTRLRHYVPSRPTGLRRLLSEVSFGLRAVFATWGRPDVVVLVSPALFASGIAMVRTRLTGTPTVVWVQDVYSLGVTETRGRSEASRVAAFVAWIESAVLHRAQGVAVIHDRFRQVVERLGVPSERVAVIRNWTHLAERTAVPRQSARDRMGWGDDEIIVLHTGAMGRKQDLDNVVRAARIAQQSKRRVRFVLMGNGGERARLEESARDLTAITFTDALPANEFQDALAAADVLLVNEHAGLREMAVPSKLTSYFSSGRPVLAATDADSVTAGELEVSGGGVRVDPAQPQLLVDAALALAGDPERAIELGTAGRRYQQTVLSERAALDRYIAWLELTVQKRGNIAATVRGPGRREPGVADGSGPRSVVTDG